MINVIVAGYTMLSIGAENFIIVLTPKLDITAENTHTATTICSYFNFPFVNPEKYLPATEVNPIEVVQHARATIIARSILPVCPNNASVIATINAVCSTSIPY